MRSQIREIIAEIFGLDLEVVPEDASSENVEGWDSLHHLELMLEVELRFGVRIETNDMAKLLSVEAIMEFLRESSTAPT